MDTSDFKTDFTISDTSPQRIRKNVFSATTFAISAEEFINEHFRGLAEVQNDVSENLPIMISSDYSAFFFKNMFRVVYGRLYLNIRLFTDEQSLNVRITSSSPFSIDSSQMNDLIRQARSAGFEVHFAEGGFVMNTPLLKEASLAVYAIPIDQGVQIIKQSFNKIFFYSDE